MQVEVELFGIPRARLGASRAVANGSCLGEVLADLGKRYPGFAAECLDGSCLRPNYVASLGGRQFVTAPETPLTVGETLLLLSIDAGG